MMAKYNYRLIGSALCANLLSFGAACAYCWTTPVLPKLKGHGSENVLGRPIAFIEESLLVSLLSLGACIGVLGGACLMDRLGRKVSLVLVGVPMVVSYVVMGCASTIETFLLGRFTLGLGAGCTYTLVPVYVAEIAETSNRGALGCLMAIMGTIGVLFCYSVGSVVGVHAFSLICALPPLTFLCCFPLIGVESPLFLVQRQRLHLAEHNLRLVRIENDVKKELSEIVDHHESSTRGQSSIGDMFRCKATKRGLLVGGGVLVLQQLSGICVVVSYMQNIFAATGSSIPPTTSSVAIAVVQVLSNAITTSLIDRAGRRLLLTLSLSGAGVAQFLLACYFHLQHPSRDLSDVFWVPIVSLMLYTSSFQLGLGSVAWALQGELFSPQFKSLAVTFTTFLCLVMASVFSFLFPIFIEVFNMESAFLLFSVFCTAGIWFVWKLVPETKGKTMVEIQMLLENYHKA